MKFISPEEFIQGGFLQEVNRKFFHPLGLALLFDPNKKDEHVFCAVADARDDPDGFIFDLDPEKLPEAKRKAELVESLRMSKLGNRIRMFGSAIQPIESVNKDDIDKT